MSTDNRIVHLESQVRTLRRMLFGVFGLVVVGGLLAATTLQSVPDVIRAKRFAVVNGEGRVIAVLGSQGGNGGLEIRNERGRGVAGVVCDEKGTGAVFLMNQDNQVSTVMGVDVHGAGILCIGGEGGFGIDKTPLVDPLLVGGYRDGGVPLLTLTVKDGEGVVLIENDKGQATSTSP